MKHTPSGRSAGPPRQSAGFVVKRDGEIPASRRLAMARFLIAIDCPSAQDLDRNCVVVFVNLCLEGAVEGSKKQVFRRRSQRFRFGHLLRRRSKHIYLGAILFLLQNFERPSLLRRKTGIFYAKISEVIGNAHHDAIGPHVSKQTADRPLEQIDQGVEIRTADPLAEQAIELRPVDHPDELIVNFEPCTKGLLGPGPIAEPARVAFARGLERRHCGDPCARGGNIIRQSNEAHADRTKTAMVDRACRRERTARIDVASTVTELQLRLKQALDLDWDRHLRSILLPAHPR